MRKIVVIASASGNGKTTLGRQLAERLGVPFIELDALVHGPNWAETPDEDLRDQLAALLAGDGWVADGAYQRKLGDFVLDKADTVVWLDLPLSVWVPRLTRRTWRRVRGREELWNGNRESLKTALWGRESLFVWAIRSHFRRRREWPSFLSDRNVVRLRTPREVDAFILSTPSERHETLPAVPQVNAIGIAVSDMARSIRFYRLLGLDVPETPDEGHVDAFLPNGVRFMLDSEEIIRSFMPAWEREDGKQVSIALECTSSAEVDEIYARVVAAGFEGEKEPWAAYWGQRYALLMDPDMVRINLYAAL